MMRFVSIILSMLICVLSYAGNSRRFLLACETSAVPDTGRMVDSRDGNSYKTIKIGDKVWMAENMRYVDGMNIGTTKSNKPQVYYPNGNQNNVQEYGYLYNWQAAVSACPEGWHLPTNSDWKQLRNDIGGDNAGSQLATRADLWNDGALERTSLFGKSGFSVLPSGNFEGKAYGNFGSFAYFWSATEYEYYSGNAYYRYIYYNYTGVVSNYSSKSSGFSVRCVKD